MATKTTKTKLVLNHLLSGKTITSLDAINLYSATRLSAIIFNLRNRGYDIATLPKTITDKYGNKCDFAQYKLIDADLNVEGFEDNLFTSAGEEAPQIEFTETNKAYEQAKIKAKGNFFQRLWQKINSGE